MRGRFFFLLSLDCPDQYIYIYIWKQFLKKSTHALFHTYTPLECMQYKQIQSMKNGESNCTAFSQIVDRFRSQSLSDIYIYVVQTIYILVQTIYIPNTIIIWPCLSSEKERKRKMFLSPVSNDFWKSCTYSRGVCERKGVCGIILIFLSYTIYIGPDNRYSKNY